MNRAFPLGVVTALALTATAFAIAPDVKLFGALGVVVEDTDGDRIPQAIEQELCSASLAEMPGVQQLNVGDVGHCSSTTNYVPPAEKHLVPLYTGVTLGGDADLDSVPASATLTMKRVTIDPFSAGSSIVHVETVPETRTVQVDPDDNDPEQPAPSQVTFLAPIPIDWEMGPDADADRLPSTLTLTWATPRLDRANALHPLSFVDATTQVIGVDPDDSQTGIGNLVDISVPTAVSATRDVDGDLTPGALRALVETLRFDGSQTGFGYVGSRVTLTTLDADDLERDEGTAMNPVDRDADRVPDSAERFICRVQREDTAQDGTCVGADGKGPDGSGFDYVPPSGVETPWDLL